MKSQSVINSHNHERQRESDDGFRECPECGFTTIKGMPGGRDATCNNCGYKDPCCYD